MNEYRTGVGWDVHRLVPGRPLILGGVRIPSDHGLDGHSDADVLAHSITDALLGAAALGDIGQHFPDSNPHWAGADSLQFIRLACGELAAAGYAIVNVDSTVILERPKLGALKERMAANLAEALEIPAGSVSVKAGTNEGLGEIGRGEAVAAQAVAAIAPL